MSSSKRFCLKWSQIRFEKLVGIDFSSERFRSRNRLQRDWQKCVQSLFGRDSSSNLLAGNVSLECLWRTFFKYFLVAIFRQKCLVIRLPQRFFGRWFFQIYLVVFLWVLLCGYFLVEILFGISTF